MGKTCDNSPEAAFFSSLANWLTECSSPGKGGYFAISQAGIDHASNLLGLSAQAKVMACCLDNGIWPLRFKGNRGLFSAAAQAKLLRSHVAIIGCGGLGGHVATLLSRFGLGALTVCDHDRFDESNLNRQLLCRESRLGMNKALAAKEEIAAIASHVQVRVVTDKIQSHNLGEAIAHVDALIDCVDSLSVRALLREAAEQAGIPCIHGAISGLEGFARVIRSGRDLAAPKPEMMLSENKPHCFSPPPAGELSHACPLPTPTEHTSEKVMGVPTVTPAATASLQCLLTVAFLLEEEAPSLSHLAKGQLFHLDMTVPDISSFSF